MFLLNPNKKHSVAHLWNGTDTVCRMFSTGGMRKTKQRLSNSLLGKKICSMCLNVNKNSARPAFYVDKEYADNVDNFYIVLPNV